MTDFDKMVGEIRQLTVRIFNRLTQKDNELESRIEKLEARAEKQDLQAKTALLNHLQALQEVEKK